MTVNKHRVLTFFIMCLSLLYAFIMVQIPNEYFRDRSSYIVYAKDSIAILDRYHDFLTLLFNEPLFLLLNKFLNYFIDPDAVPLVFVFFISFTVFYIVMKKTKNIVTAFFALILVFFSAQSFHLQFVVLRQGLAVAILLWLVYFFWGQRKFYVLIFILGFIHSSFFLVSLIFYLDKIVQTFTQKLIIRLAVQSCLAIAVAVIGVYIASILGMRQADQSYVLGPVSVGGGNFLIWSMALVTLMTLSKEKILSEPYCLIAVIGLCFYLTLYFISPISGRIIAIFLPFCFIALTMNFVPRVFLVMIFVVLTNISIFSEGIINNSLTNVGVNFFSSL